MANPQFFPDTVDGKLDHVIEECAEVILAGMKAKRFGMDNRHPTNPFVRSNREDLLLEIQDAIAAMQRFVVSLVESPPMT